MREGRGIELGKSAGDLRAGDLLVIRIYIVCLYTGYLQIRLRCLDVMGAASEAELTMHDVEI